MNVKENYNNYMILLLSSSPKVQWRTPRIDNHTYVIVVMCIVCMYIHFTVLACTSHVVVFEH